MGDAPTAPAPPDPYSTAAAQYGSNVQSGVANSLLSNPNVTNPYGSVTYSQGDTTNIGGYDIPRYNETVTLSPEQQKLYNQQSRLGAQENTIAGTALGNVSGVLNQPVTNAPQLQTSFNTGGPTGGAIATSAMPAGGIQSYFGSAPAVQQQVGPTDFNQAIDKTTSAIQARLQPQLDLQRQQLQSQLASQGVMPGSQAYETAMDQFGRQVNDANTQAVLAGMQEQNTLFGQAVQQGQFANQAQGQIYGENQGRAAFANQAQQQQFGQNVQQAQLFNSAQAQGYNEAQQAAAFANAAKLQQLQQQMAIREAPLNEVSALMKGGQVTAPQFSAYQPGTIQSAPITQSVYNSAGLANQQYLAQMQAYGAQNAGLFGLGGSVAGALGNYFASSDRRLKTDIVETGTMGPFKAYAFRYIWDPKTVHIGVMADEVLPVMPEAVAVNDNGFLMVDYSKLVA